MRILFSVNKKADTETDLQLVSDPFNSTFNSTSKTVSHYPAEAYRKNAQNIKYESIENNTLAQKIIDIKIIKNLLLNMGKTSIAMGKFMFL